jgi:DNA transformation protein
VGEKGARLTNASESFQDDVVARLDSIGGITSRKMFGGFGIFHEGAMFGIISKQRLFFKVDDSNFDAYEKAGSKQHEPMPYYAVPATVVSKKPSLQKWARQSIEVAHAAKASKSTKKK